ncbi:MAG: hypothetical protein ACREP9_13245 [Candidatus Dormibacteraceae bacterium]
MAAIKPNTPQKAQIPFNTFEKIDLRVARVIEAQLASETRFPCRVLKLDLGHLGERLSVGQLALIPEEELVGQNVIVCINLGDRKMGPYVSQALVLGAPHPASPEGQAQAIPLYVGQETNPGNQIF